MGLLVLSSAGYAQILKPVSVFYSNENRNIQQNIFPQPLVMEKIPVPLQNNKLLLANNFKCTLPKGAVFCRMEDAIYNRLNFWVKFRMGTDDRYSN